MYCYFLAKRGFNLIVVERDSSLLSLIESQILKEVHNPPKVTKICIDKFDQDSVWKAVAGNPQVKQHQSLYPVKIFVNCKNSKRKPAAADVDKFQLNDSMLSDLEGFSEEQRLSLRQLWTPAITKEEVFFTSKENIEGFVCLVAHFWNQMSSPEVESPAIINVSNSDKSGSSED